MSWCPRRPAGLERVCGMRGYTLSHDLGSHRELYGWVPLEEDQESLNVEQIIESPWSRAEESCENSLDRHGAVVGSQTSLTQRKPSTGNLEQRTEKHSKGRVWGDESEAERKHRNRLSCGNRFLRVSVTIHVHLLSPCK